MSDATIDLGVPALGADGTAEIPPLASPTLEPTDPIEPPPTGSAAPEKKRRRRRTTKPAPEAAPVEVGPTPDDIARLSTAFGAGFAVVFDVLATARGPHWRVGAEPLKAMGDTWAVAWAPYMGGAGRYMPFVVAGLTTVGVVLPCVQEDRRLSQGGALAPRTQEVDMREVLALSKSAAQTDAPAPSASDAPGETPEVPIDPPKGRTRTKVTP